MKKQRLIAAAMAAVAISGALAGCSASGTDSGDKVNLSYWLWDANQQPAYKACATAFTKANPDIDVTVKQFGWDDYWSQITTGLVSGTAPDVFTGHSSYFPTFVEKHQILPIDDVVKADDINLKQYETGLTAAWTSGKKLYGLPKDVGLAAMYVNSDMLEKAGLTANDLSNLEWNPKDGGTFEKTIAHLTLDAKGVRGDEPGFDKSNVAVYGLGLNGDGGGLGETIWGQYAESNDWTYLNEKGGKPHFNYDDKNFLDAISWFKGLSDKGYMPTLEQAVSGIGQQDSYGAGKYAMISEGSWSASTLFGYKDVKSIIAPLPIGPSGHRASPANGLADNVAVTTKHPEQSKKLVAFLGSKDCQSLVAKQAVVFPAIADLSDATKKAYEAKGIDISPFLETVDKGDIYSSPSVANWAEVNAIMTPAMQAYLGGSAPLDSFVDANKQVNALYN